MEGVVITIIFVVGIGFVSRWLGSMELQAKQALQPQSGELDLEVWWRKENMPNTLKHSTLLFNEKPLSVQTPVPLHGQVDQVFQHESGKVIPVDTKSRAKVRVYKSDVIQLSVYAVVLAEKGHQVSKYGYVRVVVPGEALHIQYVKVRLLSTDQIVSLWHRHDALRRKEAVGLCTCGGLFH